MMRKQVGVLWVFVVISILSATIGMSTAWAATYYIDYNAANDNANGTSKVTPWKHHPYMANWSGTYTHVGGDKFIFKGGVKWPNGCFAMRITAGGSSEGTREYYGVDKTWYLGASWSRPVFDLEGIMTPVDNNVVDIASGVAYVTIDNLEVVNFRWLGDDTWAHHVVFHYNTATYITFKNLYVHSWTHGNLGEGTHDGARIFLGYTGAPFNAGVIIEYCDASGLPGGTDSMMFCYGGVVEARYNTIHDMSNAILTHGTTGAHKVYGNTIYNIFRSFDNPIQHENAIETFGPAEIYDNIIYNIQGGVIILSGPTLNGGGYDYIYNNLIYQNPGDSGGEKNPIAIDTDVDPSGSGAYIYNNTLQCIGNVSPIRIVDRKTGAIKTIVIQNNHFITESASPILIGPTVINYTADHNLLQTNAVANAQSFTSINRYTPTSVSCSTVSFGISQSSVFTTDIRGRARSLGTIWDAGAYEFESNIGELSPPQRLRLK